MGYVDSIDVNKFPKQSEMVGNKVIVCFHYNLDMRLRGKLLRDDMEAPFVTIIKLEDGRYVLGTECMWSIPLIAK